MLIFAAVRDTGRNFFTANIFSFLYTSLFNVSGDIFGSGTNSGADRN